MTTKIHDLIRAYGVACDRAARAPRMSPAQTAALQLENAARVALLQEMAELQQQMADLLTKEVDLVAERDALRARLAEIEGQEPAAWRVIVGGSRMHGAHKDALRAAVQAITTEQVPEPSPLYDRPVPAIPAGCGACGDACTKRGSCRLADESLEMIPTTVCALELRRDQYGLEQQQWAWVLGMQPSHYSEFVGGQRSLPKSAMALAFAHGVPAVALFQRLPNLGAADIDRRLTQMSAAAPEAAR